MPGIILLCLLLLAALLLLGAFICYREVFSVPDLKNADPRTVLPGEQYKAREKQLIALVDLALPLPYEDVYISSADGYRLHARYYEAAPGAPVELMMHGYRSIAIRDFSVGLPNALERGHSVLLVDQRCHGTSEGRCLTFGILEREDCRLWVNYLRSRLGAQIKIMLVGVSMGAATVLMAAEPTLPDNVIGVIADSAYTSPAEIIEKVMRDRHFPAPILMPFVRLVARLFGGFSLSACTAGEVLRTAKIPVLLIHGEDDRFVPREMSRRNYEAISGKKVLLTIPEAGHGLGYLLDPERYNRTVSDFWALALDELTLQ